jgi:adenylate kinase
MLNIILFGAPGTGKGTQSENIIENYKLVHLSTGDILREEIAAGTNAGMLAKTIIDKGQLVSDGVIFRLLYSKTSKYQNPNGFIFDGFPRNTVQADILDNYLNKKNIPISVVFYLDVAEDELFRRIMYRAQQTHRSDDNEETIRKRIDVYKSQTLPLLDYYKASGKLVRVDGMHTVEGVYEQIKTKIDQLISK